MWMWRWVAARSVVPVGDPGHQAASLPVVGVFGLVVLGDLPCHPRHRRIVVLDAHQVRLGTGANVFDGLGERDHVDDELGGLAE